METTSGIERADQGHTTPVKGRVVSAGKRYWFKGGSQFEVGDVVYFRRYSVDELKTPSADGTEKSIFVCDDADIVCRLITKQK